MKITINNINDVYKAKTESVETMELKGYELVEILFVDSSGLGAEDEPAYTQSQFKKRLTELLEEHGQLTAKIVDAGMFQVNLGVFKKVRKSSIKRISTNVFEREEEGAKVYRLYNTDILKVKDDSFQIFNGGYQTRTTAKWLNKLLPYHLSVYQKNWEWFVRDSRNDKVVPFQEGILIQ